MALAQDLGVIIADDHPPTRAAVHSALDSAGFRVLAEARDAETAVAAALAHKPQVALLDVRMPGGGIEAAEAIAEKLPETAVVMLTVSGEDKDLFSALRVGASGYLIKGTASEELPAALRRVLAGEAVLPGSLITRLVDEFRRRERRRFLSSADQRGSRLTQREWEVLELLAGGRTTAEIAEEVFIAKVTVRSHVSAILRKLRVQDRAAAVRLFRGS